MPPGTGPDTLAKSGCKIRKYAYVAVSYTLQLWGNGEKIATRMILLAVEGRRLVMIYT